MNIEQRCVPRIVPLAPAFLLFCHRNGYCPLLSSRDRFGMSILSVKESSILTYVSILLGPRRSKRYATVTRDADHSHMCPYVNVRCAPYNISFAKPLSALATKARDPVVIRRCARSPSIRNRRVPLEAFVEIHSIRPISVVAIAAI